MAYWLLKTEPGDYAYADLERDGATVWSGVKNSLALIHLRAMNAGDRALVYHTGKEKAIVGLADVVKASGGKAPAVELRPAGRLARTVTLAGLKASGKFASFDLIRQPRLSVMPVRPDEWKVLLKLGSAKV
jgi:predicted RNA-binding protein with PUA-like domain